MPATRRAVLRDATESDIKSAALIQIAEDGAASLSLRGVARAIGMSPAGLYRYYDGRDELLTALLVDAYSDLADTIERAVAAEDDRKHRRQFLAGVKAYRRWALTYPNRFLLIFGTPVPGYKAPDGGPTVQANQRMGFAFMGVAARAYSAGKLRDFDIQREPTSAEREIAVKLDDLAVAFPPPLVQVMLGAWAQWHGLVLLEVTHQLDWAYPDVDEFFDAEMTRLADRLMPTETP